MQFISVRDLRGHSAEVWSRLKKEKEIVLTSKGKPIAILIATSGQRLEESVSAIRTARAVSAVQSLQKVSVETGRDSMGLDEINAEIKAARKKTNPSK